MNPLPGPFAPAVTQHVPNATVTTDRYGNKSHGFDAKVRRAIAQYPGDAEEVDNPGRDTVTADMVLLVPADWIVSAKDEWTLADGLRYRSDGKPQPYRHPRTGTQITRVNLRRIS